MLRNVTILRLTYLSIYSWLYALTLGMDANFRLKSRLRGPVARDPSLGPGLAYFVEYGPYVEFIRDYIDEEEVSTNSWLLMQFETYTRPIRSRHALVSKL